MSLEKNSVEGEKAKQPKVVNKNVKCKLCPKAFPTLAQTLQHELVDHEFRYKERRELKSALSRCEPGSELAALIDVYLVKPQVLREVFCELLESIRRALSDMPRFEVHLYGSGATDLVLRNSDIDLFLKFGSADYSRNRGRCIYCSLLNRIRNALQRCREFDEIFFIRNAKVPIIKFRHVSTGVNIDMNVSCAGGIHNSRFVRDLLNTDWRLRQLVTFIKIWAKETCIIGKGNLTSYGLIMLIVFYLQNTKDPMTQQPLVPSVQQMQSNVVPIIEQGGNFAYNLAGNMRQWSRAVNVNELISGFFGYYKNFSFKTYLISPYLGQCVPIAGLQTNTYAFPEYKQQRVLLSEFRGVANVELELNRAVCVQDPFFLVHNITKAVVLGNLSFIRKCIQRAAGTPYNPQQPSKYYEALIFGIGAGTAARSTTQTTGEMPPAVPITKQQQPPEPQVGTAANTAAQTHRIHPSRAELSAISQSPPSLAAHDSNAYRCWSDMYTKIIPMIITDIYGLDMQLLTPTNRCKQLRLDYQDTSPSWAVSGSVDLWSGRLHNSCKNKTFMEYQIEQTHKMLAERRQNSTHAVQFHAVLTINIDKDYRGMELVIRKAVNNNMQPLMVDGRTPPAPNSSVQLLRNDCVRKFFGMLKTSLQNFNLKEWLNSQKCPKSPKNGSAAKSEELLALPEKEPDAMQEQKTQIEIKTKVPKVADDGVVSS